MDSTAYIAKRNGKCDDCRETLFHSFPSPPPSAPTENRSIKRKWKEKPTKNIQYIYPFSSSFEQADLAFCATD